MAAAHRVVHHLHLTAGSEVAARRVLPTLEDALRCASLGDDDARLLVVRRLALGRIAADINAQALSRLIEQRVAEAGGTWVSGGTPAADTARAVVFASALDARVQLAVHLLRGERCGEWYWPLAVPEFVPRDDWAANLRRIAVALSRLPEARTALPAWATQLVRWDAAAALAAAIAPHEGEALLQRAGIAVGTQYDERLDAHREDPTVRCASQRGPIEPIQVALPRWLHRLLEHAACSPSRPDATRVVRVPAPAIAATVAPASSPSASPSESSGPAVQPIALAAELEGLATSHRDGVQIDPLPADGNVPRDRNPLRPQPDSATSIVKPLVTESYPYLEPTACAGLLFLLSVLGRLGLARWSEDAVAGGERFPHRVLKVALQQLNAAPADPAWRLIPIGLADGEPLTVSPPSSWRDPLLIAPHARRAEDPIGDTLQHATSADAQAAVWLRASRRWLRRRARIGLATLVLRPGFISLTPTHVDIHFHIDDTDVRVRRAGLDLDPGWLPWFGRVVSFRFHEWRV